MSTKSTTKERYLFLDLIKVIAIYVVCFYHCHNYNANILDYPSASTYITFFIKGIGCVGVPLFFMVNGALMLNKEYVLKDHIKKIVKVVILIFAWAVITLLALMVIKGNSYTVSDFMHAIATWENGTVNHLWFLHTLVCLYILFPVMKAVYDMKDQKILRYLLIVIFIFTFGNVLLNMGANILESICGVNYIEGHGVEFFNCFQFLDGFYAYSIVYFILGGLIFKKLTAAKEIPAKEILVKEIPAKAMTGIFAAGLVVLFLYGVMMSRANGYLYDTVWEGYDTVMALAMCTAVFLLCYRLQDKLGRLSGLISAIGQNTLGIFFVHRIVWECIKPFFVRFDISMNIVVNLLFAVVILLISLGIVLLLKKIPGIKWLFNFSLKV